MCCAVASFSCIDATGKYLIHHMDTLQVVWARYFFAAALTLIVTNPITRPGLTRTQPAVFASRTLGAVAVLDRP